MGTDRSGDATSTAIATRGRSDPSLRRLAYVLASIALLAAAAVLAWAVLEGSRRVRPIGDGHDPASYQFDLGSLAADPGLAASGRPRDYLPSLDRPQTIAGSEVAEFNASHRRRPVVTTDRVVGVVINGEARAYPVPLLEVHEIVNDQLGGVPIAVSFSPLADMAVVFRRDIEGEVREFGLSGLMLDATHLLYDRTRTSPQPESSPSLWSPIRLQSVAGPLESEPLSIVPMVSVANWGEWLNTHPETTVALGDLGSQERDRRIDYTQSIRSPGLPFPVGGIDPAGTSPSDWIALKSGAVAIRDATGKWQVRTLEDLRLLPPARSSDSTPFSADPQQRTVLVHVEPGADRSLVVIPCMHFAAERLGPRSLP